MRSRKFIPAKFLKGTIRESLYTRKLILALDDRESLSPRKFIPIKYPLKFTPLYTFCSQFRINFGIGLAVLNFVICLIGLHKYTFFVKKFRIRVSCRFLTFFPFRELRGSYRNSSKLVRIKK
jgi:hypothetical protein